MLLDVREPWEAQLASIPNSVLVPLGTLETAGEAAVLGLDDGRPIVVYCHSGIRSAHAVELLQRHGVEARSLAGGIDAWSLEVDPSVVRY
jgi:rhodanese-related sulfurtransferase